jgi:phenylacetate-CoA ligase
LAKPSLSRQLKNVPGLQRRLKTKPESYWIKRGEQMALRLFHEMARRVPAYKDFLAQHQFDPKRVQTIEEFKRVPLIDKDNYLRQYPREMTCWDGKFAENRWVISTTSGSTGEPFYFPRSDLQDEYYALTAELYLRENFYIQHRRTLYVDAFAMGAWIGGLHTYQGVKRIAEKGYPLSIITPGVNRAEVINSVRNLGPNFDQVIIGCYPPILRDIIDLGIKEGLKWEQYNLGVVFAAEGFSESFRDYVASHGYLENIFTSSLNQYGTVDLGIMSHETPTAIAIRRQATEEPEIFRAMFGELNKQPTFTQFLPEMFYFEEVGGGVVCSSYSGLPLVRYDLKDHGGVLTQGQVGAIYQQSGKVLRDELKRVGIDAHSWNLPFVYVYERSDFSVTFSGAQIYPEEIRRALLDDTLQDKVTGKFTMIAGYDKSAKNYLEINVELMQDVEPSQDLVQLITKTTVARLLKENSEYRSLYGEYGSALSPHVKLWPNEHPLYFSGKGKQKWVQKQPNGS